MSIILTFIAMLLAGIGAGVLGALVGLGGGVVIVPVLTLFFGVPIIYATGASLVSTIATSSSAASAYVKDRITNIRIGMSLEIATTAGAIVGALLSAWLFMNRLTNLIFIIFGIVLIFTIVPSLRKLSIEKHPSVAARPDKTTRTFQLYGKYEDQSIKGSDKHVVYFGVRWWLGETIMLFAGIISGLLGIGSGVLKVLGMDWAMKLPIKVTTTTSNFMIGVTAATGSAIYWALGYIQPFIAASTAIGVLIGSFVGSRMLVGMKGESVRVLFLVVLGIVAIEMILRGIGVA